MDGSDDQQPSLAVDPRDGRRVAIAYQVVQPDSGHRSCGLALSSDGGASWAADVLIGLNGRMAVPEGFGACWNTSVAYGPDGALYYAFQTSLTPGNPYSHVLVAVSSDGGRTFATPLAVDATSPAFAGQRAGGDWWPSIAVDPARNVLYVTWSRFTADLDSSAVLAAVSTNDGRAFSRPARVSPTDQLDVTGSAVAVGPDGSAYITWTDYTQWERGDLLQCGDSGCSPYGFTPAQMQQALHTFYSDEGPSLDFTQGLGCEAFRTADMNLEGRGLNRGGNCTLPAVLQFARSSDGGLSWQQRTPPASSVYLGCYAQYSDDLPPWPSGHVCDATHYSNFDHNLVRPVAAGSSGTAAVAWWDTGGYAPDGTARVSVATTSDGAATWHTSTPVCEAPGTVDDQQHRPSVSVAPNGRADLVCYDVSASGTQEVYWASAPELGAEFSSPFRIDSGASNTNRGPLSDDGRRSFGDHLAVASSDPRVAVAWTDSRRGLTDQAVYFAAVLVPHPSSGGPSAQAGPPWGAVGGAVAAAAACGAGVILVRRRARPSPTRVR